MRRMFAAAALASLLLLPACGGGRDRGGDTRLAPVQANWRAIVTPADRERLRTWRDAWTQGIAKVTAPADLARVSAAGILLQPDAAQMEPTPPPGNYRCRVFKIGAKEAGGMNYVAAPPGTCRIAREGDVLSFARLDGPQRPTGLLFPDDGGRLVFLGSMILGDETRALDYGRDPERDVAGLLERIGPRRWRLVLPFPHWETTVEVMELVPAGG